MWSVAAAARSSWVTALSSGAVVVSVNATGGGIDALAAAGDNVIDLVAAGGGIDIQVLKRGCVL